MARTSKNGYGVWGMGHGACVARGRARDLGAGSNTGDWARWGVMVLDLFPYLLLTGGRNKKSISSAVSSGDSRESPIILALRAMASVGVYQSR